MADLQDKNTIAQANAENPFMGMSREELLAYKKQNPQFFQQQQQGGGAMETLRGVGDIWSGGKSFTMDPQTGRPFAVDTGVKRATADKGDLNVFMMKELMKQQLKQPEVERKAAADIEKAEKKAIADIQTKAALKGIDIGDIATPIEARTKLATEIERQTREKAEEKAKVLPAKIKQDIVGVRQQIANVENLEQLAEQVPSGAGGMFSIARGAVTRGAFDKETRLYLKQLPAFAAGLYRDLTGDKRLSDEDASARAMPLLWHPSEDESIKKASFENIKKALRSRQKLLQQGTFSVVDGEAVTPLGAVLSDTGTSQQELPTTAQKQTRGTTSSGLGYTIER